MDPNSGQLFLSREAAIAAGVLDAVEVEIPRDSELIVQTQAAALLRAKRREQARRKAKIAKASRRVNR